MSLFKKHLYAMSTYEPPLEGRSVQQHLLLDFNERTLPVSKEIEDALVEYIRSGALQKYPSYGDLPARIAEYVGVDRSCLMITNGSDQGIDLAIRSVISAGEEAIIPVPSFAIYRQFAEVENATILEPQYSRDSGYPLQDVLRLINSKTRLIVVPNPNNPTGTAVPEADVIQLLEAAPNALVLVDECYYEYLGETLVGLVEKYPNLLITRTFSKTWGLSSLRMGFIVSHPENIAQLLKVRGPYDINQLAVVATLAALKNPDYTRDYVDEVMNKCKPALEAWCRGRKIDFWPSRSNYIWMFPPKAAELEAFLRHHNILVRPKKDAAGQLGLRVNLGNLEQTQRLLDCLNQFYCG